jgi:SAM-dependent methyltransferase
MDLETSVARHYEHGSLEQALVAALKRAGKDVDRLTHADLAPVDEFHVGGRPATRDLGAQVDLPAGARVLDIGSGIGGPARFFAAERGWRVEGVDLTAEFVEVAKSLSIRTGFGDRVSFRVASATALPFSDGSFDGAYMLHVGMNIADKKAAFAEIRRVLKSGAIFAMYDLMRAGDGEFSYPVPWASEPATNHIEPIDTYRRLLGEAGFKVEKERNRRDFAIDAMRRRTAQADQSGLGLPVVMGADAAQKLANMGGMIQRGTIAPTELIARAV